MANLILAPSTAPFRSLVLAASAALALACSSSSPPDTGEGDPATTTTTGGTAGSGSVTGSGGDGTGTGTTGSGGASSATGGTPTTGAGGSKGTGGATGGSGSVNAGGSPVGVGPIGGPTIMYTVDSYNNASWAGGDVPGAIVVNGSGYLPMAASDCPKDPDMANVAAYKDKIFNGCLDECAGDSNMAGHGKATVIDWNVQGAGWAAAQVSSTLHWTGMWPPTTGSQPTTLVFWIKGANGNEQDKFTLAIHAHLTNSPKGIKIPIQVTQAWQRVVIPWDKLMVAASPYPDALVFAATGAGKATFFIDQAYLSKTVAVP